MKNRLFCFVLSSSLALASACPALAAWTPLQPGWTVHEVPIAIVHAVTYPALGALTIDPLTGDLFLAGSVSGSAATPSLYRLSQSGQLQDFGLLTLPSATPVFDPVHRVVLVPQADQIARFTENGAPLAPIDGPPAGPLAVGPDGELYAVTQGGQSPTGLQIERYDSGLGSWVPSRDVPATVGYPGLDYGSAPDQLVIDASGREFASRGGAVFRIDDASTVFLGGALLSGQLASGLGMALLGGILFDPDAAAATPAQGFASPPSGHACLGVALTPDGTVVILDAKQNADLSESFALEIFRLGVTPAVRRSWGSLKTATR